MATVKTVEHPIANKTIVWYMVVTGILVFTMMIFGLIMLLNQGKIIQIQASTFYEILTAHGTNMILMSSLGGSAIMWYFLNQYVKLSKTALIWVLILFLVGLVLTLVGEFGFHYAAAWTLLYPLSTKSAGGWGVPGAELYLGGMLVCGVAFLLFYLDCARAITKKYGSLFKGLGWDYIFTKKHGYGPPGAVIASCMAIICDTVGIVAGAIAVVMNMVNVANPSITVDPLMVKELTYIFGHIFANVTIYKGVIAVYEILPKYTNRSWGSNKVFIIGWMMSTIFTLCIFTHHMYMDFAMPHWLLISGQIISYGNGLPVLVVTAYGALMIVWRSGIKWDLPSSFMFLSMFGWSIGVVPALADATIVLNGVMHNTRWVPGHFHMYMGIGVCSMLFGFMYYILKQAGRLKTNILDDISLWVFAIAFIGLCSTYLYGGIVGAPRRWAEHLPQWIPADQIGALFAVFIILAVSTVIFRLVAYAFTMSASHSEEMKHVKHA